MTQLFLNSIVTLKLNTGIALGAATNMKVLWEDPEGVPGQWATSTIDGTKVVYDVVAGDVTVEGTWKLQAYVEIAGLPMYGAIVTQKFNQVLNPALS